MTRKLKPTTELPGEKRDAAANPDDADRPDPLPGRPACPVEALTGPLGSFVAWGVRDGLHPDCMLAGGLAALVTLTGPARLKLTEAKTVRAILWIVLVGIASAGKSPAFEHAFALIREAYQGDREAYASRLASWREDAEARGKKEAGPPPRRPEPFELDDATVEAVARWLMAREDDGDTSGSVIDDELAAFLESLNQYKGGHGSDLSKWLKMWTGAPLHVQRVGKGGMENEISLYIPEPVVSVAGPLVPDNIHLLGKPGSGFRPRWLPFYAPPEKPGWHDAGAYPDEWAACIVALTENRKPRDWFLQGDARTEWAAARDRWDIQQYGPEPDDVIEALRKADAQCLRIALVIAESMNPGVGGDIPVEAVRCAVAIVNYAIGVWRVLPGNSTMTTSRYEEVMDTTYRRFLSWLEGRPKGNEGLPPGSDPRPRATRRDIQQWLHEKPAKLNALIQEHAERWGLQGVVTVERERDAEGHGGHTATYIFAPPRAHGHAEAAVAATAGSLSHTPQQTDVSAGRDDLGPLLRTATAGHRNSGSATAGSGRHATPAGDPAEGGPEGSEVPADRDRPTTCHDTPI